MKNLLLFLSAFSIMLVACNNGGGNEGDDTANEPTEATPTETNTNTDAVNNANSASSTPQGPFAELSFEKMQHDFGTIQEGDVVSETFTFTNTGETDLIISNAKGSCGCTVPSWPKEPIAPGATGEIVVEYNSKGKSGPQNKVVTITANTDPNITQLKISSTVVKGEGAGASAQ